MHHRGREFMLNNDISYCEANLKVSTGKTNMVGNVGRRVFLLRCPAGAQTFMEDRRVILHGLTHIEYGRQEFIVNFDKRKRLLGEVRTCRGHGGDGMPMIEHFVPGEKRQARWVRQVVSLTVLHA